MSVFFALDMTIGPRVSTSVVCKKIAILLRVSYKIFSNLVTKTHILIKILFESAISIIFRDNNTNVTFYH
jgi:hypothetical protein